MEAFIEKGAYSISAINQSYLVLLFRCSTHEHIFEVTFPPKVPKIMVSWMPFVA